MINQFIFVSLINIHIIKDNVIICIMIFIIIKSVNNTKKKHVKRYFITFPSCNKKPKQYLFTKILTKTKIYKKTKPYIKKNIKKIIITKK